MGEFTDIGWTEATWNPWYGCTKISPGCKFCYMYREMQRYGRDPFTVQRSKTTFNDPLKWKEPRMVFTCSWSDFFIEAADAWRTEAWDIIRKTPHLTYQILTKRPELIAERLPSDWGGGYPNVWLGVSVESPLYFERIVYLQRTPGGNGSRSAAFYRMGHCWRRIRVRSRVSVALDHRPCGSVPPISCAHLRQARLRAKTRDAGQNPLALLDSRISSGARMNWLMRYRREIMVAGVNARMRKLLGASIVPAKELKAKEAEPVEDLIESAYISGQSGRDRG